MPVLSLPDSMGEEHYARKLNIFTGVDVTPEDLERMAYREVQEVRRLIEEAALDYWKERYKAGFLAGPDFGLDPGSCSSA